MKRIGKTLFMTSLILGLGVAACAKTKTEDNTPAPNIEGYPNGTFQTGPNTYMVPLVELVQGCQAYRQVSPGQMTIQIIYFRHKDGTFSPLREEAECA